MTTNQKILRAITDRLGGSLCKDFAVELVSVLGGREWKGQLRIACPIPSHYPHELVVVHHMRRGLLVRCVDGHERARVLPALLKVLRDQQEQTNNAKKAPTAGPSGPKCRRKKTNHIGRKTDG
jgi:hypothetical protein